MTDIVEILVEESSMENFLRGVLPKLLPKKYKVDENCFIRPHEGKSHLQKSIPRKVKAFKGYTYTSVKLIIIHDQDSNECKSLKTSLVNMVEQENQQLSVLVRIACRELENWYLGDLDAIQRVYPDSKASRLKEKARFRNCDVLNGAEKMKRLTINFTKSFASREIPKHMNLNSNHSVSFNHFITGLKKIFIKLIISKNY